MLLCCNLPSFDGSFSTGSKNIPNASTEMTYTTSGGPEDGDERAREASHLSQVTLISLPCHRDECIYYQSPTLTKLEFNHLTT